MSLRVEVLEKLSNLLSLLQETLKQTTIAADHPARVHAENYLGLAHAGLIKVSDAQVRALIRNCHAIQIAVAGSPDNAKEELGQEKLAMGLPVRGNEITGADAGMFRDLVIEMVRVMPFERIVQYINCFADYDMDMLLALNPALLKTQRQS